MKILGRHWWRSRKRAQLATGPVFDTVNDHWWIEIVAEDRAAVAYVDAPFGTHRAAKHGAEHACKTGGAI